MRQPLRRHVSFANVVSLLALFVALGGTSYAALTITSKHIKNRSVNAVDVRKNALTGVEIRESRLGAVPRADDAGRLGGRPASAFQAAARTSFAEAKYTATTPQTLAEWPEMDVTLTTDGDADGDFELRLDGSREGAPGIDVCTITPAGAQTCTTDNAGGSVFSAGTDPSPAFLIFRKSDRSRQLAVQCFFQFVAKDVGCFATRSTGE